MFKILILEDAPELQDRIAFILESVPGVSLEKASDRKHAVELVNRHEGKIDLLIIDHQLAPLTSLSELQKVAAHITTIFCVPDKSTPIQTEGWKVYAIIERAFIASLLLLTIDRWKTDHQDLIPTDPEKFCRIKTRLLMDVNPLHADIYAKLSEIKYLKIFRESDVFDSNDLERYAKQKKIEYMYLLVADSPNFVRKYTAFIEDLVRQTKPITIDEVAFMHVSIQESVRELTEKLGFTEEVQGLAKSQVQLTVKTMGKKPDLKNMLRKLEAKHGQYISDHSFLTGYIACGIAAQMDWNSETTYHKLMLAAFMHDIVLNDDRIAECESIAEAEALNATEETLNGYKKHPAKIAEMVKQMSDIPADVDSIILQHHELPDGHGFPRSLTASHIAPLSGLFIVAHDMAKAILKEKEAFSLSEYVTRMHAKWPQNLFKKILNAAGALTL